MKYVSYFLDAEEPIKMGDQGSQANCDALSYIAGSAIRGAVISECVKAGMKVERLVKETRFFDAYIVDQDSFFIPVPSVYYADKHAIRENELLMQSGSDAELSLHTCLDDNPKEGEQRVDVGGFCRFDENERLVSIRVRKTANLHIKAGQTSTDKAMYRYEAIEEKQSLSGAIVCAEDSVAAMYRDLINGKTLYLGGSKGSGYGRCHVRSAEILTYDRYIARYGIQRKNDEGNLIVYAFSNLLPNDESGAVAGEIPAAKLEAALRITNVELVKSYVATGISGGFNHTWRAGNVQRDYVKAGSVFVYTYQGTLNEEKVLEFEECGIGMRRQDGFGRILINPELNREKKVVSKKAEERIKRDFSPEDRKVLELISGDVYQRRYQKSIETTALRCADQNRGLVDRLSMTQKTRLWQLFSELTAFDVSDEEIKQRVRQFYDKINLRKTVSGETAVRTSSTTSAYNTAKVFLPGGNRITINELLEDLIENHMQWGKTTVPCLAFAGVAMNTDSAQMDTPLKTKVRLLRDVFYDLVRKEGGKKR